VADGESEYEGAVHVCQSQSYERGKQCLSLAMYVGESRCLSEAVMLKDSEGVRLGFLVFPIGMLTAWR
jgi:hypothetical protein